MYENMRADLPDTLIGARIEGEMSVLWDAAELLLRQRHAGGRAEPGAIEAVAGGRRGRL